MKTAIVTTCYLDNDEYYKKTIKFIEYYNRLISDNFLKVDDIILFENNSSFQTIKKFNKECRLFDNIIIQRFNKHMTREDHLKYPYLWRAVYNIQDVLKNYDKVIYMDNDFFLTSKKSVSYINSLNSNWSTFYCNKHKFNETGIHIVEKNSISYNKFVSGFLEQDFINKYNGKTMECVLPVDYIEHLYGDRWSEYGEITQKSNWDYSAQTPLLMNIQYYE